MLNVISSVCGLVCHLLLAVVWNPFNIHFSGLFYSEWSGVRSCSHKTSYPRSFPETFSILLLTTSFGFYITHEAQERAETACGYHGVNYLVISTSCTGILKFDCLSGKAYKSNIRSRFRTIITILGLKQTTIGRFPMQQPKMRHVLTQESISRFMAAFRSILGCIVECVIENSKAHGSQKPCKIQKIVLQLTSSAAR